VGRLRGQRRGRGYLLEHEPATLSSKNLAEQVRREGFPTGDVDVILENWGHDDLKAKYIDTDKTAQSAGEPVTASSAGTCRPG
jgi:hypothetical protein